MPFIIIVIFIFGIFLIILADPINLTDVRRLRSESAEKWRHYHWLLPNYCDTLHLLISATAPVYEHLFLSGLHRHKSSKMVFLHEVSGISLRHEVGNLALTGCSEFSCCFLPFDMASWEGLGIWWGCLENEIANIAHPTGRSPGAQHTTGSVDCWIIPLGPGTHLELCQGQIVLIGLVMFGISRAPCWHSGLVLGRTKMNGWAVGQIWSFKSK